jgi:uncharacterized membrane protein
MNSPDGLFPDGWVLTGHGIYIVLLLLALTLAPWRRLRDGDQLNVFLGTCVALMVLWRIRAGITPGLDFHLLGATLMTLMFGWQLALVGLGAVLAAVTFSGAGGLQAFSLNAVLVTAVPVSLSSLIHLACARWLPKHFFVYVFVNGFFNAAAVMACTGIIASLAYALSGTYPWAHLASEYLPYYLLMLFPEAILTGSAIALMVVYRPHWVATFDDATYLRNK